MSTLWADKKLGDIAKVSYGFTAKAKQKEVGPRFLRITDIKDQDVNWSTVPFCQISKKDHQKHGLNTGDIVFARTGATTGKSYLVKNPPNAVCASYLIKLSLHDKNVSPDFLILYFQTKEYWETVYKGISGSAQGGFNASKLSNLEVPLPPLPEQKSIVAILDKAFAAINQAITHAEKNLANARELFESYLNNVFTQKGEGWGEKKLGDFCERVSVGHVGATTKYYCEKQSGIPFIRSQNVRPRKLDLSGVRYITKSFHNKLKKSQLSSGDLLFVRVGANRGDCCAVPDNIGEINCANIVFSRLTSEKVQFVEYFCQSPVGKERLLGMTTGSAQGVINTKSVAELLVPLPPPEEQEKLVAKFYLVEKKLLEVQTIYQQKLTALTELKQSILQKAFAGELTTDTVQQQVNG